MGRQQDCPTILSHWGNGKVRKFLHFGGVGGTACATFHLWLIDANLVSFERACSGAVDVGLSPADVR